jgi:hypothetical protein
MNQKTIIKGDEKRIKNKEENDAMMYKNYYEKTNLLCSSLKLPYSSSINNKEEEEGKRNISTFYFIENEITNLIEEENNKLNDRYNNNLYNEYTTLDNIQIRQQTNEAENEQRLKQKINHICRNEQGFAVFWLTLLLLIQVLNVITIGLSSWILSVM